MYKSKHGYNPRVFGYMFNPLSANPIKWSNTLKQFVGNLPTNCLSVFDHFVKLALKRLCRLVTIIQLDFRKISLNNQKHEFTKHEKQLFCDIYPWKILSKPSCYSTLKKKLFDSDNELQFSKIQKVFLSKLSFSKK